jgi:hypothetical protein
MFFIRKCCLRGYDERGSETITYRLLVGTVARARFSLSSPFRATGRPWPSVHAPMSVLLATVALHAREPATARGSRDAKNDSYGSQDFGWHVVVHPSPARDETRRTAMATESEIAVQATCYCGRGTRLCARFGWVLVGLTAVTFLWARQGRS